MGADFSNFDRDLETLIPDGRLTEPMDMDIDVDMLSLRKYLQNRDASRGEVTQEEVARFIKNPPRAKAQ